MTIGEPNQAEGAEQSDLGNVLARIRDGDEFAARELLQRYEPQVRLVVRRRLPRLLRGRFDSLDFMQSVWRSFFRRMQGGQDDFKDPQNLVAFLARAARNKVIDEHRRASTLKYDVRREESLGTGDHPLQLVDRADSPSEVVQAGETLNRLRQLLPEGRQAILELKAQGLGNVEIATRLGMSERTVRRVLEELRRRARFDCEGGGE